LTPADTTPRKVTTHSLESGSRALQVVTEDRERPVVATQHAEPMRGNRQTVTQYFSCRGAPMSWEQRGLQQYYYRVRRGSNGQLIKTYYGTGPAAQRAAQDDDQKRTLRQQERIAQQHIQSLETQLHTLTTIVRTFVTASLLGHGFHQHQRGEWRRWRH